MANDMIERITQAEKQGEEIVNNAKIQSAEIIEEVENKIKNLKKQTECNVSSNRHTTLDKAKIESDAKKEEYEKMANEQIELIEQNAKKNRTKAIESALGVLF